MQGPPLPASAGGAPGAAQGGEASAGAAADADELPGGAVQPAAQAAVVPDVREGPPPVEPPTRPPADDSTGADPPDVDADQAGR
jgi:hypothetical protein